MADYAKINNIPLKLQPGGGLTPSVFGTQGRAQSSKLLDTRRGLLRGGSFSTPLLSEVEAEGWKSMLLGRGVHWSFDDGFKSDHGVLPYDPGTASLSATVKFGAFSLSVPSGTTYQTKVTLPGNTPQYTVLMWYYKGGVWYHRAILDNGNYRNGVPFVNYGTSISLIKNTNRTVTITVNLNGTDPETNLGAIQLYDDLVILPYRIPSTWLASLVASTRAFSRLPFLELSGDILEDNSEVVEVVGSISRVTTIPATLDTSWDKGAQELELALVEV